MQLEVRRANLDNDLRDVFELPRDARPEAQNSSTMLYSTEHCWAMMRSCCSLTRSIRPMRRAQLGTEDVSVVRWSSASGRMGRRSGPEQRLQ